MSELYCVKRLKNLFSCQEKNKKICRKNPKGVNYAKTKIIRPSTQSNQIPTL